MNKKLLLASVVLPVWALPLLPRQTLCEAQKAAAPDLVGARDNDTAIEEVYSAIDENASSEASANVLKESVGQIYADKSMDVEAATRLIGENCEAKLGA